MEKDLVKFNGNLKEIKNNGEVIVYSDEKGNYFTVALALKYQHIAQLLLNCEYIEADEKQMKALQYNGDIPKDITFTTEKATRPVSKYEITKKEKDMTKIVDTEVEISKIWLVKNGFKLTKAFQTKENAIEFCENENAKLFSMIEK